MHFERGAFFVVREMLDIVVPSDAALCQAQFPRKYVREMLHIHKPLAIIFKIGYAFLHDKPAASSVSKTPTEQRDFHANR